MIEDEELEGREEYLWDDVDAARKNERLQQKHPASVAKEQYLTQAKSCPKCGTSADRLTWFYFDSPKETWKTLCGCAGWMTVCDACHVQVDFFLEVMS